MFGMTGRTTRMPTGGITGSMTGSTTIGSVGIGGIGGIISAAADVANTITQIYYASKNYQLQKEQMRYQKYIQQMLFEREDTAIRRRVEDLQRAGLSPTLAAGSAAGAGGTSNVQAPQMNMPDLAMSGVEKAMALMMMEKQFYKTDAETALIEQQRKKSMAETSKTNVEAGIKAHDLNVYRKSGLSSNASAVGKTFQDIVSSQSGGMLKKLKAKWAEEQANIDRDFKKIRQRRK